MLSEVRTEIIELAGNKIFTRNLSLTFIVAIAALFSLADLQSNKTQLTEQTSITNISDSSSIKIIVGRK